MAGAGFKTFNTGDVLTASDVNTYLMQQTVMVFADSSARSTALGANVAEGMISYLKDTNTTAYYDGSSWVTLSTGGDITEVAAGTGISGGGTSGSVTITNSMATAIDAKGDLIAGTGADTFSRLAVGSNNQVLTADSTTATGLKWGAVPAPTYTWTSYTPTVTGLTKGNGTEIAKYMKFDKLVIVEYQFTFGSTSAITGLLYVNLPSTAANTAYSPAGTIDDYGTANYQAQVTPETTRVVFYALGASGTYANSVSTSSTVPMTWTTNDAFRFTAIYEEA